MKTAIMTIIISVLLFCDHVVLGQEGEWTVVTANADVFVNIALKNFVNDTLRFSQTAQNFTIPIASIVQLRKKEGKSESNAGRGARIGLFVGALIGGVVGAIIAEPKPDDDLDEAFVKSIGFLPAVAGGSLLGGLGGTVTGAVIGSQSRSSLSVEWVYTFSDDTQTKSVEIRAVLANK